MPPRSRHRVRWQAIRLGLPYYHKLMLEIEYSVNQECIAQFFPIEAVVSAKLRLFEDILGQSLRRYAHSSTDSPDHALTWHEDVELYDVWDSVDRGGGFLGCLYLDLYSRPTRYTHVANFNLQLVRILFPSHHPSHS